MHTRTAVVVYGVCRYCCRAHGLICALSGRSLCQTRPMQLQLPLHLVSLEAVLVGVLAEALVHCRRGRGGARQEGRGNAMQCGRRWSGGVFGSSPEGVKRHKSKKQTTNTTHNTHPEDYTRGYSKTRTPPPPDTQVFVLWVDALESSAPLHHHNQKVHRCLMVRKGS